MEGVLILDKFHPLESNGALVIAMGVILAIVFIGIWIVMFHHGKNKDVAYACGTVGLIVSIICTLMLLVCWNAPIESKTYYKVYCDETVNIVEFNETYKIIGQEGKIYIVEEIDKEEK